VDFHIHDVLGARLGAGILLACSLYCLIWPERFGMRMGVFHFERMPNSPLARVFGIAGGVAGVTIVILTFL
jgi:hypothetical protein